MARRIQTWEGTRIPIGDGVRSPKGFLSIWADPTAGIVGLVVSEDPATPDLGALLDTSCRQPSVGPPRKPDKVRLNNPDLAPEVARRLPALPIEIGPTPEVDHALAYLSQAMGLDLATEPPPSKNILGKPWRDPTTAVTRRLDTVGAAFLAARPWDHIDPEEVVDVSAPTLGVPRGAATVVGHNGTHFGFALALERSHIQSFMRLATDDAYERPGARLDDDILMFEATPAGPDGPAYADLYRLRQDLQSAPADATEYKLIAAVVEAFVVFARSTDRSRPTREGPVTLTLSAPAPVIPLRPHAPVPPSAPTPGRSRWGFVRDRMLPRLSSWAQSAIGGWEHHMDGLSELASPDFLWCYALFVVPFDARDTTAASAFRLTFLSELSADELSWLDANIDSAWTSYWSVIDTDPGRSMTLRDIFSEEVRTVTEVSASRIAVKHDLLCARVVTFDDESYLDVTHPFTFGPSEATLLRHHLAANLGLSKRKAVPVAKLRKPKVATTLVLGWNQTVAASEASRSRQRIQNTDGEDLVLVTETFTLAARPVDAGRLLTRIDGIAPPTAGDSTWTLSRSGNAMHASWDNTVIARLRVDGTRIIVDTNSRQRADHVASTLKATFGPAITASTRHEEDSSRLMQERASRPQSPGLQLVSQPEAAEAIAELKRRAYATWPDEPIPALGNMTPRAAAKTAAGRKKLVALIEDFERMEAKEMPAARFDFDILRRQLGLIS